MKLKLSYLVLLLFLVYVLVLIKTAWLCDDAYITFRTIDNFIHGFGLRWNVNERVQSYTHPLWMFLLSGFYALTHEIYFTSIFISIVISVLAIILLVKKISISPENTTIVLIMVIFSKSFIDFSTSGLENPLTHLLLVIFGIIYLKEEESVKKIFILSFITSLVAINRMDIVLVILPALVYKIWVNFKPKNLLIIAAGLLPFIIWEIFSVIYYGFPFPNTAYAKLNTGIPASELFAQGIKYYANSLRLDPITLPVIFISLILSFVKFDKKIIPLSIGIILYMIYVLKVGGDFMSGRFFSAIFLMGLIIIAKKDYASVNAKIAFMFILLAFGLTAPYSNVIPSIYYHEIIGTSYFLNNGISDEKAFYSDYTLLTKTIKSGKEFYHVWAQEGKVANKNKDKLYLAKYVGFWGFYAGPGVHIIDALALNDPLLARLSAMKPWRIGHFERAIPSGYVESSLTGGNCIKDENIRTYYSKLCLITQASIFDTKRIKEIMNFNLGKYDYLVKDTQYPSEIFDIYFYIKFK